MSAKHNHEFEKELARSNKPSRFARKSRNREVQRRSSAEQLCHVVKKFPRDAARSESAMEMLAAKCHNGDSNLVLEAVQYLFENERQLLTYNRHFGFVLRELARHGHASRVYEITKQAVKQSSTNVAANSSMGSVFEALLSTNNSQRVARLIYGLSVKEPELLSQNSESGWTIDQMIQAGHRLEGIDTFIVLATHHPKKFANSESVVRAIDRIKSTDFTFLGEGKVELVGRLIDKLIELRNQPGLKPTTR